MTDGTDAELAELIRLGRKYLWAQGDIRRRLEEGGVFLARNDFYSEYPTLADIESSYEHAGWADTGTLPRVYDDPRIFDAGRNAERALSLAAFTADFAPPMDADSGFFWRNTQFSSLDAMAYYGLIAQHKPRRVIEIGSGNSTFVAAAAKEAASPGTEILCIDPEPRADISQLGAVTFRREIIQNVPVEELLTDLGPDDLVFYDGSHTVKTGSDTVYFYLKILPYLPQGVLVHAHDVALPYARRIKGLLEAKISWGEQYLVMAHLHNRARYRVEIANWFLAEHSPEAATALMHGRLQPYGGSLWFRIIGP